ncbi:MAG: response regulator transcription factor [Anaerolineales bacterium]|nr:response regulator transcription factor [Anaerolineales bacterium]
MKSRIRVAIMEDHQSIIDGYVYRLSENTNIDIVGMGAYGEEIEPMLKINPADVLLLDINLPTSTSNPNPFPVLYVIPRLLEQHTQLSILIISMLTQRTLVESMVNIGVSGYIFKDDQASIQQLAKVVTIVANGGIYFSKNAYTEIRGKSSDPLLTPRQLEVLSLCAAYPDISTSVLAEKLDIASSTLRNLLSGVYLRLGVRTRAAAIVKAQYMNLLPRSPHLSFKKTKV